MKRTLSLVLCIILAIGAVAAPAYAAEAVITKQTQLNTAFEEGGSYVIGTAYIGARGVSVQQNITLRGDGNELRCIASGVTPLLSQDKRVTSVFSDLTVGGNEKQDVGIRLGDGTMQFDGCTVQNFAITGGWEAALAVTGNASLLLKNTAFVNNTPVDISLTDKAVLTLQGSSALGARIDSRWVKIHLSDGWSGALTLRFKHPVAGAIGTVGAGVTAAQITVTNPGYYVEVQEGTLYLRTQNTAQITFDMAQRETLYKGSAGFLYGEAEINVPSVDLLYGLKPDTMVQKTYGGLQHPTGDAVRVNSALRAAGVRDMQVYFQDGYLEWPYDAPIKNGTIDLDAYQRKVEGMLYAMICSPAAQDDADGFLGSDGKYYKLNDHKNDYSYVLFNEPDQIWYGGNLEGLENAWLQLYTAVHRIDPDARCAGPNYSGFNAEHYAAFLKFCYDNNCLPEVISWHELGDISLTDYYDHYNTVKTLVAQYYTESYAQKAGRGYQPELIVNEYARHYDIGAPGGLVKWLAMLEDKDMSGCMAYWAMANTLNEMAADQNSPTSTWWVYHWYAQMTGEQCPLTAPDFADSRLWGVTSYDAKINTGYTLFGGDENQDGSEAVRLENMNATALLNAQGAAHVKLYGVSFSGQLGVNYKPAVLFDGNLAAENGALTITVQNTDEMDAFFAVITPAADGAAVIDMDGVTYPALRYEAENAVLLGGATAYTKDGWATFATSGRADVGSINNNGDGVAFEVAVPESGTYIASLYYSLQAPFVNPQTLVPDANGQNRGIGKSLFYGVRVDGEERSPITLESTVTWAYKNHCDFDVDLTAGAHTIEFYHIGGDQGSKGNLQLVAALDKLDLEKQTTADDDFEIDLSEMEAFRTENGWRVTAVAPQAGYYSVTAEGDFTLQKQCLQFAPTADSFDTCTLRAADCGHTLSLAQGANTLLISGNPGVLKFHFEPQQTSAASCTVKPEDITRHGNSPALQTNSFATSGAVLTELGIGQNPQQGETAAHNYAVFTVSAAESGVYTLAVRYTNNEPAPVMLKADGSTYIHPYNIDLVERYLQVSVNGGTPQTAYFKNTLSRDTFKTVEMTVQLQQGENEIRLFNDNSYQFSTLVNATAPEIDTVTLRALSAGAAAPVLVPGAASTTHTDTVKTAVTPATASKNGTIKKTCTCTTCGFVHTETKRIAKIAKVTAANGVYSGKKLTPKVRVTDADGKTIAATNYTVKYSNNVKVGKGTATVTFKGNYSGTKTANFVINPKATTLSKVSSPAKKQIKITWKKQTAQTKGYQIQISTDKNFKKGVKTVTVSKNKTTAATVKKLTSKKTYYVRVRTYQSVGKTKYYSTWSKVKSVKVK